jgi:hypothetical protein
MYLRAFAPRLPNDVEFAGVGVMMPSGHFLDIIELPRQRWNKPPNCFLPQSNFHNLRHFQWTQL